MYDAGKYGFAVDTFSLGVALYEVWTGEYPYFNMEHLLNKSPYALEFEVQNGLRPSPVPEEPEALKALVEICWHQDPAQRPTMQEVVWRISTIRDTR